MKKLGRNGSHVVAVALGLTVVAVVGIAGWRVLGTKKDNSIKESSNQTASNNQATSVTWSFDGDTWKANDTPPACPDPLKISSPVDVSKATAILYPGQYRGTDYKAHGGFRFDGSQNSEITVKVPMDAKVVKGSRYIEQNETQYLFFFIAPCGIMYKFDHILTLSPAFQTLADKLPAAKVDDSRTTDFDPPVFVKTGGVVATAVGFKNYDNVSVDFGVYDLRTANDASKNSAFASAHDMHKDTLFYGICWFDLLPSPDSAIVKSLPGGDSVNGKTSDYCK